MLASCHRHVPVGAIPYIFRRDGGLARFDLIYSGKILMHVGNSPRNYAVPLARAQHRLAMVPLDGRRWLLRKTRPPDADTPIESGTDSKRKRQRRRTSWCRRPESSDERARRFQPSGTAKPIAPHKATKLLATLAIPVRRDLRLHGEDARSSCGYGRCKSTNLHWTEWRCAASTPRALEKALGSHLQRSMLTQKRNMTEFAETEAYLPFHLREIADAHS